MSTSTVTIHPKAPAGAAGPPSGALPPLIETPAGLALLELQGTVNLPPADADADTEADAKPQEPITIGCIEFPDYVPGSTDDKAWMRRVQLYVGAHQRLTGEVKKLPKPVAIVRRRTDGSDGTDGSDDLEVVEVVHYKLLFSSRPEPMTESGPA